jgi:hypothetical protein
VNRLYNVISSYEEIGFSLVFRRINEGNSIFIIYGTSLVRGNKRLYLTRGFREVFAKQKFGKIQQEFSSKSLLNEGERSERQQAVPEDLRSKPQSNFWWRSIR